MKLLILFLLILTSCYQEVPIKDINTQMIEVEINGEVKNPGVYILNNNSTLNDLLLLCGGISENADISRYSLNMPLYHLDIIEIGKISDKLISINLADLETLMQINGIGISTAQSIIDYRNTYGLFTRLEDLMLIRGIKQKKFDKIKAYIKL